MYDSVAMVWQIEDLTCWSHFQQPKFAGLPSCSNTHCCLYKYSSSMTVTVFVENATVLRLSLLRCSSAKLV